MERHQNRQNELTTHHEPHPSPTHRQVPRDPLRDLPLPNSIRGCLDASGFLFVTVVLIVDIITDILVVVLYGLRGQTLFMGVATMILTFCSIVVGVTHIVQMKGAGMNHPAMMGFCFLANLPFQFGVIIHRLIHFGNLTGVCCVSPEHKTQKTWVFAKLKLVQSVLESAPLFVLNIYSMLVYTRIHTIQYASAICSLASLILGASLYEKARKERLRGLIIDYSTTCIIFLYKTLVLIARLLAFANFVYFFKQWLGFILLPHFAIMFVFFAYIYRKVWKINYYRILVHSLYCVLAYFPIHNEYRPEGEIMMYYTLFIVENVLMVSLPYGVRPIQQVSPNHMPGSRYYKAMTVIILVGSALGLCFMAAYYFFCHKNRGTIRHVHFNWLGRICDWSNKRESSSAQQFVASSGPENNVYVHVEGDADHKHHHHHSYSQAQTPVDDDLLDDIEGSAPPSYRTLPGVHGSHKHMSSYVESDLEATSRGSLLDDSEIKSPMSDVSRPSVLSGDEGDDDTDSEGNQPLQTMC